jgi:hypothetical protein
MIRYVEETKVNQKGKGKYTRNGATREIELMTLGIKFGILINQD